MYSTYSERGFFRRLHCRVRYGPRCLWALGVFWRCSKARIGIQQWDVCQRFAREVALLRPSIAIMFLLVLTGIWRTHKVENDLIILKRFKKKKRPTVNSTTRPMPAADEVMEFVLEVEH